MTWPPGPKLAFWIKVAFEATFFPGCDVLMEMIFSIVGRVVFRSTEEGVFRQDGSYTDCSNKKANVQYK